MKGEWGPYIVMAFFIYCMQEKLMSSYWGISCLWALTFFNIGKAKRSLTSETWDCKASNLESLCRKWELVNVDFLQIWACVKELSLSSLNALPVLVSKGVSGEPLSELLGSSKGETFGVVPVGRGVSGAAGVRLVGKFWNILLFQLGLL